MRIAYDGKYYPAAVIAKIEFNAKNEGKIVDFSLYDKYKIVGFTIFTKDSPEKYYGKEYIESLSEDQEELIHTPVIIKNVLVYQAREGDWLWKSAE